MKTIIERKLPLDISYALIDKKYVSLTDGMGCTCDNCGQIIANIATISDGSRSYNIGFDCLDTTLRNNHILSQVDISDFEAYKLALRKIMRLIKRIKEVTKTCKTVTGIAFERPTFKTDYHTFHWLHRGSMESRDNDNEKIKDVSIDLVYKVISDYFKSLTVILR